MNKTAIIITIVVVVLLIGGGLFLFLNNNKSTSNQNNTSTPSSTTNENQPAATTAAAVSIENFSFNPETLTIKQGDTVTWTNKDSAIHTIKSDSFNSQDIAQGGTYQFKFNNKGTFDYSCGIHPSMTGKIIVE